MRGTPAFDVVPHAYGPAGLRAWFTEPPGAVVQMATPARGSLAMAEWLVGPGFELLRRRFPNSGSLILVIDLSLMEGRDVGARSVMMDKAREMQSLFARTYMVPPIKANPIYMTTLHAAAALLTAFGVELSIESSLAEVIASCKLRPA